MNITDKQATRELYMKAYNNNKNEVDARIADGIEKNRKGNCRLKLTDSNGAPLAGKKIKIKQKTHDFNFGANIFLLDEFESEKDNEAYRKLFKEHFNAATVPFYWDGLEPEEGKPRYSKDSKKVYRRPSPDLCVEYCEENGIRPKLHCLVYDKFVPEWLRKLPIDEVKRKYEQRFKEIADRYTGKMFEFEVINEMLQMYFWNKDTCSALFNEKEIGNWSFEVARKYFPNETLVLNEGNLYKDIAEKGRFSAFYLLCENLLLKGVSIDKIGQQHHMFVGAQAKTQEQYEAAVMNPYYANMVDPNLLFGMLDVMADFNRPFEITEVTVPTFGETEEDEQLQADILKLWYSVWFSHPLVDTIVYWNTVDGYAYAGDAWNENNCRGGLWHHDLTPKKSADMLRNLINNEWHTECELTADDNGTVEFRGFYGDYELEADGSTVTFGNHRGSDESIQNIAL